MTPTWLHSRRVDGLFILLPPFLATALAALWSYLLPARTETSPIMWLLLIVGVDVAHVYSSFFRVFLRSERLPGKISRYYLIPIFAWTLGVALYRTDALNFWRALAYLAVFHFVRQQYGFFMIYAGPYAKRPSWSSAIDKSAIYVATIYPLFYWHLHLPLAFNWFVEGDFFTLPITSDFPRHAVATVGFVVYAAILCAYVAKEFIFSWRERHVNWPQQLMVLGTALSWYVGIVALNQDLAFTAINVVSHGIPYLALIWLVERSELKAAPALQQRWSAKLFQPRFLPLYVLVLVLAAYLEEGLWDAMVWRDHSALFAYFSWLPVLQSPPAMAALVPLLALPQATHYLLDAFIWRQRPESGDNWLMRLRSQLDS